jgi:hypothetical protein
MRRSHQAIFAESAEWIRGNPLATTHDVPDRLVENWVCDLKDATAPTGFHLSIFALGYCQRQLVINEVGPDRRLRVEAEKLIEMFQMWQLKLGLIEVHRKTNLRVGPMALFDFPRDEEIEYWRTAPS